MQVIAGLLLVGLVGLPGCSDREQPPVAIAPAASPEAIVPVPAAVESTGFKVVLDVMQVVGRTEAEVSTLLGPPSSCQDIHRARLCTYGLDEDEVMFVAGKADMITVQGMDAVAFNPDALQALGLARAEADHSDEHAIRWESIPDLEEVTVFRGHGDAIDYAYIKVGRH